MKMLTELEKQNITRFLDEDVGFGDVTTALVPETPATAEVVCKQDCILAGMDEADFLFRLAGAAPKAFFNNGDRISRGTTVMKATGPNKGLLQVERTILNLVSRMSGVATMCSEAVATAKKINPKTRIAIIRKTLPGLTAFDKKAARIGGADTHRMNLEEMVLIKNNHLVFFKSVSEALKTAKEKTSFSKKIEIETRTPQEALEAADDGPDIIMLDNFSAAQARETIPRIRRKNPQVLVELSGGITLDNLADYVKCGADVVSMGMLTKDAKSIDFSMRMRK